MQLGRFDMEHVHALVDIAADIDRMSVDEVRGLANEMQSWGEAGGFAEHHGEHLDLADAVNMDVSISRAIVAFSRFVWLLRPDAIVPEYKEEDENE